MSQVNTILNMLKPLIAKMSASEKSQLLAELTQLLNNSDFPTNSSQTQSNTVSGVTLGGGENNALNFSPMQNQGGNASIPSNLQQTTSPNANTDSILGALQNLKQGINSESDLNPLLKNAAEEEVQKLEQEMQKTKPDPSFVEKTVKTLQQGLQGVKTLAKPTQEVASMIARLYES